MKKSDAEKGFRRLIKKLDKKIGEEIRKHKDWCSPKCSTFLPDAYRKARQDGYGAREVQKNYDACHIWR